MNSSLTRIVVAVACLVAIGCNQKSSQTQKESKPVAKNSLPPQPEGSKVSEKIESGKAVTAGSINDEKSASTGVKGSETEQVKLGSPELTAGIAGEGALTIEQIRKWLDDPKNHVKLDPILPKGLDAGSSQIKGLDKNPLTRAKIELGRQLYFDTRLSKDATVSCAECHSPEFGFAKNTQFGIGIKDKDGKPQLGGRNSPTAYNRILSDLQFWDGRAATLEEQAKGPIQNPIEMGFTHEACVNCIKVVDGYRLQFQKIFGDPKDDEKSTAAVNIDNIANAIASFERAIVTGPSPFDYQEVLNSVAGQDDDDIKENPLAWAAVVEAREALAKNPMSEAAKKGRTLFFGKANCTACHVGPNLSDEKYHNLGVGMEKEKPDLGRFIVTNEEKDKGAFKTPTIRNVALTAPYMHDGSQKTLEEVVDWYVKGGHPNPTLDEKMKKLEINQEERDELVAFMKACTGEFPKVNPGRIPE